MQTRAASSDLINRLAGLEKLSEIPREELVWLVDHSEFVVFEEGEVVATKGGSIEWLYIILSGKVSVRADRGAGPRLVMEWGEGESTGRLPFSRMTVVTTHNYASARTEAIIISKDCFPELIRECPAFTAMTVHSMLDRARTFNSSALQDEKLVTLGRLAAGLAHELNNPASAIARNAELLLSHLTDVDAASRVLGESGLPASAVERLDSFRASRINLQADGIMSALERADVEDEMVDWLEERGLDAELAGPLVEPGVTLDELKSLASDLPEEGLDAALRWIGAGCAANMLAREIRAAAGRVNELVAAFKSFTYMDRKATPEAVELEPGLRDTMRVLASKAKSRDASVRLTVEPDLPLVHAVGSELNQVWMNLIDNALDAVSQAGEIDITVARELDRMVVRVVDNGSGIPEDVMDHIFDPFYTTKPPGEGTGLGLEIARQIVRRYQGDIFAVSRPGRTEFTVSLMPRE